MGAVPSTDNQCDGSSGHSYALPMFPASVNKKKNLFESKCSTPTLDATPRTISIIKTGGCKRGVRKLAATSKGKRDEERRAERVVASSVAGEDRMGGGRGVEARVVPLPSTADDSSLSGLSNQVQ